MIRPETYSIVLPLALQSGLGIRAVLTFARKRCCASSSTPQKGMLASFYEASIPFRFPALAKADRLYELNSEEKCERRSTRCCRDLSISKNPPLTKSK